VTSREAHGDGRRRIIRALLAAALVAASIFVSYGDAASLVGDRDPGSAAVATLTPRSIVRHAPGVVPVARTFAVMLAAAAVLVAAATLAIALWGATDGRRLCRAERWCRRRGPPLTI
jgi:hypothetical protein